MAAAGLLGKRVVEEPVRRLRARVERFLVAIGAFKTLHDAKTGASLGEHLMGTFNLLVSRRCAGTVCAAGALHSVYGTTVFRFTLIQPTREGRETVWRAFGRRAEHLAYLFHCCKRPDDIESGMLVSRTGTVVWSQRDVIELRLVEAANMLEQGYSLDRFPTIAAAWQRATADANAIATCEFHSAAHAARARAWAQGLQLLGCPPRYVLRLAYGGHELDVQLPVRPHDQRLSEWLLAVAARTGVAPAGAPVVGFVLAGEGRYGMPPCGLELLGLLCRFACCRLSFEPGWKKRRAMAIEPVFAAACPPQHAATAGFSSVVLPPPRAPPFGASLLARAIPLGALVPQPRAPEAGVVKAAGLALVEQMRARGWAKVAVGAAAREAIAAAYDALRELVAARFSMALPFDGGRSVGYGSDGGREYVNWRAGLEDDERAPWPPHARPQRDALARAHGECEKLARAALGAVLCAMADVLARGLRTDELLAESAALLAPVASEGGLAAQLAERSERQFGPSVQRFLLYRDRPPSPAAGSSASIPHADMGLLTLAPPASIRALELVEPCSRRVARPEEELAEGECLLFAGETLAFLTAGALQAPVHHVPWVERGARPPRCAAPFFLRAPPWALLRDPTGSIELSCRELMERHCATRRPWRGIRRGAISVGDW